MESPEGRPGPDQAPPPARPQDGEEDVDTLLAKAELYYEAHRYRQALALCQRLEAEGRTGGLVAVIREGCENVLRRRRALRLTIAAAVGAALVLAALLYVPLTRLRFHPPPGALHIAERESVTFRLTRPFGRHRKLHYAWSLLDAQGRPVGKEERDSLAYDASDPWTATYTAPLDLATAAEGQRTAVRQVRVAATTPRGEPVASGQWTIEVANAPTPPVLRGWEPPVGKPITALDGTRCTFRVDAVDGDGGSALRYQWLVDGHVRHQGAEPQWTYAAAAERAPGGPPVVEQRVACRVSNRNGPPLTESCTWRLRLLASNAAPQIVKVEPDIPPDLRIAEGQPLELQAHVYDADKEQAEKDERLRCRWHVGGTTVATGRECTLVFPHDTTITEKAVRLTLTVTDRCGAADQRSWSLIVVNAPR
ncbi:MAG: hypothetical protein ACLF0G_02870 [Candidatus Brocadiia bacterium]